MVNKGNHPQMAQQFRLVNYSNLPRYIYGIQYWNIVYILEEYKIGYHHLVNFSDPIKWLYGWL